MIPKFCPECGRGIFSVRDLRYDHFADELYNCNSCNLIFGVYTEENTIQHRNGYDNLRPYQIEGPLPQRKNEWQPIDTIPKNATDVELLLKDGKVIIGHWACDLSGEEQPPYKGIFTRREGCDGFFGVRDASRWRMIESK